MSTCKPPEGSHVKIVVTCARCSSGRLRSAMNMTTDTRNASAMRVLARYPDFGSPIRRPTHRSTPAPRSGSSGTSHSRSSASRELMRSPPIGACASALQHLEVVGRGAAPAAEDGDDDGETHGNFRGGHHEREEHDHLTGDVVEHPGERDEGEVDRVQHELDAHEHHEHVATNEQPDGANCEEQRRD